MNEPREGPRRKRVKLKLTAGAAVRVQSESTIIRLESGEIYIYSTCDIERLPPREKHA